MRTLRQFLPANTRGNPLLGLLLFAGALVGAYEAAHFILAGDMAGLAYVAIAFIVAAFVVAMLNDWKRGIYIFLVWLLFEDFARKYLGNNMAIYFAKDFLAAIVYLAFFAAWRRKQAEGFRPVFLVPLLLMVWFGTIQMFNPTLPHVVFGILGMKVFFFFVPLMFVGYALVDSETELRRFFKINLIPMIFIAALGIVQSIVGPTFLNPSVLQDDIRELSTLYRISPISGMKVYRPTSVFVSTGRFVDLLIIAWLLALGYLGYTLLRHKKGRTLPFLGVTVTAAAIVLAASRGAFAYAIINGIAMVVAFLWGAPWREREVARVLRTVFRASLGVCLAVVILMASFPEATIGRLALYSETMDPSSPASELVHRARDYPLNNFLAAFTYDRWPYGYGIGSAALGVQYVSRILGIKPLGVGVESGFGEIVIEMGIGGLILWVILSAAILLNSFKTMVRLRGSVWFPISFVIFWFALLLLGPLMVGGIQAYEDYVLNAYLWLLLGVLQRLPKLKTETESATVEQRLAQPQLRWTT